MEKHYQTLQSETGGLVKSWTEGVPFETEARLQLQRTASLLDRGGGGLEGP